MINIGVDTQHLKKTSEATTALAFVSLTKEGEGDFAFTENLQRICCCKTEHLTGLEFDSTDILHFCSVDLVDYPIKQTHIELIDKMLQAEGTVIFDPNLRFPLWDSTEALRETVLEFIPKAHILKSLMKN